ncbi:DrmB family protein [Ekhidna sp.]|uniref:DrmB family protein n=1 Tax=Ekhidna sp. TaxID=2608089 RepID=UPI003CCBBE2D
MSAIKPVRRSQLISPWGVGHMINFPNDESLMVAGLDLWEEIYQRVTPHNEFTITEERLARRLGVKDFRLPPDFRDPEPGVSNPSLKIPFIRFPRWHYCTRCGYMEKVPIFHSQKPTCGGFDFGSGRSCSDIPVKRRQRLIPVRFIAVCPHGHIQDFPFIEWVHQNPVNETGHQLRLRAGRSSGALSGIELTCSCGIRKTMVGAFNEQSLTRISVTCSGDKPWLGIEAERGNTEHCGQHLTVVQKGASNVYFSQVRSSIYLPQWESSVDRTIVEVLEKNWKFLTSGAVNGNFDRLRFELVAEQKFNPDKNEYYLEKLLDAASRKLNRDDNLDDDSEERYRKMEYDAILSEAGGENQDFYVSKIVSSNYDDSQISFSTFFSNIGLVRKLRETRAFVGFSRLLPEDGISLEDKRNFIKLNKAISWLPAIAVKGEGVFFEFDHDKLKEWSSSKQISERTDILSRNYNLPREQKGIERRELKPEFILIHTFAHLIINQFSFECGYGSSSLRERIYCNLEFPSDPMNGVLIYTASGDSEGSLGGLVRQGNPGNLEEIVYKAIENARWCSSDPICIDTNGQGPNSCNLAACHNCALLPETSCEESNMLLDRAMLIGTLDNPSIGYFNQ